MKLNRKALTAQEIAAIASGAAVQAAAEAPAAEVPAAETQPAAEVPAAEAQPAAAEASAAPAPAAADPVLEFVRAELTRANDANVQLRLDLAKANEKLASMAATHEALVQIAAGSTSTMKVALGMPAIDMTAMSAEALLAEHEATKKAFNDAFKPGGVAAVSKTEETVQAKPVDPIRKARLAATGFNK